VISRLCEEFHCLPSAAIREWRRAPLGLLETILEMRQYVTAKRIYEQARSAADLPASPLITLVRTFDFDLAAADIEEARRSR
jgi:hypothetical protein